MQARLRHKWTAFVYKHKGEDYGRTQPADLNSNKTKPKLY